MNYEKKQRDIELRHNIIQCSLYEYLVGKHGKNNVREEQPASSGGSIDVMVRKGQEYVVYEIKTASVGKYCIREALPQLLEYSNWPGSHNVIELIIVGEYKLNKSEQQYLKILRDKFSIPIYFQRFDLENNILFNKE